MTADGRDFLGRGWRFPVGIEPGSGRTAHAEYEEDIEQAIRIILGTAPGERVMQPDFGCGVHRLPFESIDSVTLSEVKQRVRAALGAHEPRIEVESVEAAADDDGRGVLRVSIEYRVHRTNQRGNLTYPFGVEEAS